MNKKEVGEHLKKASESWPKEGNHLSLEYIHDVMCNVYFAVPFATPEKMNQLKMAFLKSIKKIIQ